MCKWLEVVRWNDEFNGFNWFFEMIRGRCLTSREEFYWAGSFIRGPLFA